MTWLAYMWHDSHICVAWLVYCVRASPWCGFIPIQYARLLCVVVCCSVLQCVAVWYSVLKYTWVMSHIYMSHVTRMNGSCHRCSVTLCKERRLQILKLAAQLFNMILAQVCICNVAKHMWDIRHLNVICLIYLWHHIRWRHHFRWSAHQGSMQEAQLWGGYG